MRISGAALVLALVTGAVMAQAITIPTDQPVCKLYGLIQVLGTVAGILLAAYGGFLLTSSHEMEERFKAKLLLSGVVIGIIIIWIAPVIVKALVNTGGVCGW